MVVNLEEDDSCYLIFDRSVALDIKDFAKFRLSNGFIKSQEVGYAVLHIENK